MTIDLVMKTRLVRIRVGGNCLKKIRAILLPMQPTTFPNTCPLPFIQQNMMWN